MHIDGMKREGNTSGRRFFQNGLISEYAADYRRKRTIVNTGTDQFQWDRFDPLSVGGGTASVLPGEKGENARSIASSGPFQSYQRACARRWPLTATHFREPETLLYPEARRSAQQGRIREYAAVFSHETPFSPIQSEKHARNDPSRKNSSGRRIIFLLSPRTPIGQSRARTPGAARIHAPIFGGGHGSRLGCQHITSVTSLRQITSGTNHPFPPPSGIARSISQ
jgi:hypothetical protein